MHTAAPGLSEAFRLQAGVCEAMGSAFHARLGRLAADDLDAGGPIAEVMGAWRDAPARRALEDAAPLRLLGAIQDLSLSGEAPSVTAQFPTPRAPGDAEAAWGALLALFPAVAPRLREFVGHEPQTNEVMRSACLLPGFIAIARATGLPLRLIELGASAGLNQFWDRFAYDYGERLHWGDAASGVRLTPQLRGARPRIDGEVSIASRLACDRAPVDIRDPLARRRLQAYVWPDQFERLERLDAAIAIALQGGVEVRPLDARAFVVAEADPRPGVASVIFHSIFWQYLSLDDQASLSAAIHAAGARASDQAPLAWLRMEPRDSLTFAVLSLTLWPGGAERQLATSHPHGAWIDFAEWTARAPSRWRAP
ncbi:MAG TPA: DUF2332 domain-containing protein [Caulobacteraceae bacterium]|nr:DUF2332 domain-containing protein [Caulobacteraceae bacterium]